MFFWTSENEFSGIIYSLFRGRQNIYITIFSTCHKMCNKMFGNRLTNTSYVQNIFDRESAIEKKQGREVIIFPENLKKNLNILS